MICRTVFLSFFLLIIRMYGLETLPNDLITHVINYFDIDECFNKDVPFIMSPKQFANESEKNEYQQLCLTMFDDLCNNTFTHVFSQDIIAYINLKIVNKKFYFLIPEININQKIDKLPSLFIYNLLSTFLNNTNDSDNNLMEFRYRIWYPHLSIGSYFFTRESRKCGAMFITSTLYNLPSQHQALFSSHFYIMDEFCAKNGLFDEGIEPGYFIHTDENGIKYFDLQKFSNFLNAIDAIAQKKHQKKFLQLLSEYIKNEQSHFIKCLDDNSYPVGPVPLFERGAVMYQREKNISFRLDWGNVCCRSAYTLNLVKFLGYSVKLHEEKRGREMDSGAMLFLVNDIMRDIKKTKKQFLKYVSKPKIVMGQSFLVFCLFLIVRFYCNSTKGCIFQVYA